jgi:hypothetical protein
MIKRKIVVMIVQLLVKAYERRTINDGLHDIENINFSLTSRTIENPIEEI